MTIERKCFGIGAAIGIAVSLLALPGTAGASLHDQRLDEVKIADCIHRSAGGRDWLEKTLWGLRDHEGGWIGAKVSNRDGTHDLGPLQINSWWVSRIATVTGRSAASVRWWLIHDACFNVDTARWIFLSALTVTHDYWRAVGVYHSPKAWQQRRYVAAVTVRLRRRFGPTIFQTSAQPR